MSEQNHPPYGPLNNLADQATGLVWQPYAMGGGQWVMPQTVRLCDSDIDRIARRVVELITSTKGA